MAESSMKTPGEHPLPPPSYGGSGQPGQATPEDLVELWRAFFTTTPYLEPGHKVEYDNQGRPLERLPTYADRIRELAGLYPKVRSLEVSFEEVDDFSPALSASLLQRPKDAKQAAELAVLEEVPEAERERVRREGLGRIDISVEPTEIPREQVGVEVRNIRKEHLNRLISVKALVRKALEVRPRVTLGHFVCEWQNHINRKAQDFFIFREPRLCRDTDCKCTDHRFIAERSIFVDSQSLEVQEFPEALPSGAQPERLMVYAEGALAARIMPGDRVVINGILRQRQKRKGGQPLTTFDIYLHAISIDERDTDFEEIEITEEDRENIMDFAHQPNLRQRVVASIAPSIYGMEMAKTAIALMLFGGVSKKLPDKTRIRGDIHMLLVGDPGIAKSQLLRYVSKLAPRGILTSGKSTTSAGLTAAAVRDEFGDGRWTLEAGALVMADGGIACIDEIDKMSEGDTASMHEAMEQQTISVAKAGITAELQARCTILGAANPKYGRFDQTESLHSQIKLPPTLLSRFDVIFALADEPNPDKDGKLANHILASHHAGELFKQEEMNILDEKHREESEHAGSMTSPSLDQKILRKYLALARREYMPILSRSARDRLQKYYVRMRSTYHGDKENVKEKDKVSITPRQLEALVRLSEASARMHLRQEVTDKDALLAIDIMEHFIEHLAHGDVDSFMSEFSADERATERANLEPKVAIMNTLNRLANLSPDGLVEKDELIKEAMEMGQVTQKKANWAFMVLREEGKILERSGRFVAY